MGGIPCNKISHCTPINIKMSTLPCGSHSFIPKIHILFAGEIIELMIDTGCGFPLVLGKEKYDELLPNMSSSWGNMTRKMMGGILKTTDTGLYPPYHVTENVPLEILEEIKRLFIESYEKGWFYGFPRYFSEYEKGKKKVRTSGGTINPRIHMIPNIPISFVNKESKDSHPTKTNVNVYSIQIYSKKDKDEEGKWIDTPTEALGLSAFKGFGLSLWPAGEKGFLCQPGGMEIRCNFSELYLEASDKDLST